MGLITKSQWRPVNCLFVVELEVKLCTPDKPNEAIIFEKSIKTGKLIEKKTEKGTLFNMDTLIRGTKRSSNPIPSPYIQSYSEINV